MGLRLLGMTLWPFPPGDAGQRWLNRALAADETFLREACLERAAGAGSLDGVVLLGDFYATHGQRDRALALFRKAAELGHPVGAYGFAELIRWEFPGGGRGLKESFRWYMKSAEAGFGPAQQWLARAYESGEGVPQDSERAATWTARVPTVDWPPEAPEVRPHRNPRDTLIAYWDTLNLLVGQFATRPWFPFALAVVLVVALHGLFWMLGAPSCGLILAFLILGLYNLSILRGPFRRRLSIRHLEWAAERGDRDARHRLGLAYRDGSHDVARDRILACQHLRIAAEAGQTQAMVDLAELLFWGLGGELPNRDEARAWLERARTAGHPGLTGEEIDLRLAATLAGPGESTPGEQKLQEVRHRWHQDLGPRFSRGFLAVASVLLFGILVHQTYRNTSWLGRRDRNRIVWGEAMNRVVAPRDPHATIPIPAAKRARVEPFPYVVVKDDGGLEPTRETSALLGRPVMLVLARGRYPAFRETLTEMDALTLEYRDRAAVLSCFILQNEDAGGAVTVQAWLGNVKYFHLPLAIVQKGMDQPALGDLSLTPVTLVLDREGRIRQRWVGYQPGLMKAALDGALLEGQ